MKLILFLVTALFSANSYATSCETNLDKDYEPYLREFTISDIVFYGEVTSQFKIDGLLVERVPSNSKNRRISAFQPEKMYKNNDHLQANSPPYDKVIFFNNIRIVGQLELEFGKNYLVFGKQSVYGLYTITEATCGRSGPISLESLKRFEEWKDQHIQKK